MSTYTDGYDHGNTMKEQLENLKAYLNSVFNQISELDKIQEESLQSIVDEWHRLNEYSIVAVFDCQNENLNAKGPSHHEHHQPSKPDRDTPLDSDS
ncbi:hypothetical protein FOMG_19196 [Fusarium oxysporum f. sp. melonis 26406]|uniref:Uncharacterized protein n=1 Tax=Fusarium oxysporum f. sp. melonis 26406 TaxID=1089452 RepID=W9YX03_FUSOX|nr:hypothetical protein FOMG_19196 [Fusarium oxysporum f. sp. melonis 26406]